MKMGKVYIEHHYIIDLDNPEMVEHAKIALEEDLKTEVYNNIIVKEELNAQESDIAEFLLDKED